VLRARIAGRCDGLTLTAVVSANGQAAGRACVPARGADTIAVIALDDVRPWSPADPFLYDLHVSLHRADQVVDQGTSYVGLRSVHVDGHRILLNGRPCFQRLVLDQGFYPDGIYTAPTDDALRADVEMGLAMGFDGARLHQKVFEPRLLYWADKLGYLVWGEYPSWGLNLGSSEAVGFAAGEWREILVRDRNHPSIVGWCPLNETAGGADPAAMQAIVATTQTMDPTRPFLDTSGYVHLFTGTDVYDCHDYNQTPESFAARYQPFSLTGTNPWNNNLSDERSAYRGQPYFVSEYGGMRLKSQEGGEGGWGYGETELDEFLERYKALTDALLDNPNMFGFCYTQLTDIEQEQNGIYYYDRSEKYDPALIKAINERPAAYETEGPRILKLKWRTLVPNARDGKHQWRYTHEEPGEGWEKPGFDDGSWETGPGGFGKVDTPGAVIGTTWEGDDIWLRRTVEVGKLDATYLMISVHHDEDAEVYVNGKQVATFADYTNGYIDHDATETLREALIEGKNTLAVHCRQTTGGQFIDVGVRAADAKE